MYQSLIELSAPQALMIFLLLGALLGIALGLILIFRTHWLAGLGRVTNRWVSLRFMSVWMDTHISLEHWFYRHHRPVGVAAMAGAIYVFVYFAILFDKAAVMRGLGGVWFTPQMGSLLDALVLFALTSSAVAVWVGLFLWLRPSWLRGVEHRSNAWISSRRATKSLDVEHIEFDDYVIRHARASGSLLLLASLVLLLLDLRWWL